MEFPDLGKHCAESSCNQLDFLPYHCKFCGKDFCDRHWKQEKHNCKGKPTRLTVIECPLCQKQLKYDEGKDNPDQIVDRHIRIADCLNESDKGKKDCAHKGCHKKALISCPFCSKSYCTSHRFQTSHVCPQYEEHERKEKHRNEKRAKKGQSGGRLTRWIGGYQSKAQERFASKHVVRKEAKGPQGRDIAEDKRIYFEIFYLKRRGQTKARAYVFVDTSWTVGRALDEICDILVIQNRNDQFQAEKTRVYLNNGVELEHNMILDDLKDGLRFSEKLLVHSTFDETLFS